MKGREYVFVLITSICFIFALISFQNKCSVSGQVSNTQEQIDTILTQIEPSTKIDTLTADLQQRIAKLDEIIAEYERISQENRTFTEQLHDFGEVMDEVGKMEQEGYMRTH